MHNICWHSDWQVESESVLSLRSAPQFLTLVSLHCCHDIDETPKDSSVSLSALTFTLRSREWCSHNTPALILPLGPESRRTLQGTGGHTGKWNRVYELMTLYQDPPHAWSQDVYKDRMKTAKTKYLIWHSHLAIPYYGVLKNAMAHDYDYHIPYHIKVPLNYNCCTSTEFLWCSVRRI